MTNEKKHHYRKVHKSDHLGVADLEDYQEAGHNLQFTISYVRQEIGVKIAGNKCDKNVAYFNDVNGQKVKPLALNATNAKVLKSFANGSPFVEDWSNMPVQLYIDAGAKLMGEVVGGVRIHPKQPSMQARVITPEKTKMWNNAKTAFKRDGNLKAVLSSAQMSEAHQTQLIDECNEEKGES